MTVEEMVDDLHHVRANIQVLTERASRLELEIQSALERDGASEWIGTRYKASLQPGRPNYNDPESKLDLRVLLEDPGEEVLQDLGAYIPAHQELVDVKEKWLGPGLSKVRKLGTRFSDLIDGARRPRKGPRLIIKAMTEFEALSCEYCGEEGCDLPEEDHHSIQDARQMEN